MAATAAQRALVKQVRDSARDTNLPAIAIQVSLVPGTDPSSDQALLTPSVVLKPVMHPVLAAMLAVAGARRLSDLTYAQGLGEDNYTDAPLRVALFHAHPGLVWPEALTETTKGPRDMSNVQSYRAGNDLITDLGGSPAGAFARQHAGSITAGHPNGGLGMGLLAISRKGGNLYFKARTHKLELPEHLPQVRLNLAPAGRPETDARPVLATHALAAMEWLVAMGVTVFEEDANQPFRVMRERIERSVIAYPTPGRPAFAEVSVGRSVRALVDLDTEDPDAAMASRGRVLAQDVEAALRRVPAVGRAVHPSTTDAGRLSLAEPFNDDRLRDYQKVAVGRHLTTTVGYLNSASPGTGKTVMSLSGMRERSRGIAGYRGMVVVEANVRAQWGPEAEKWFPQAKVVTVTGVGDAARLRDELAAAGDEPLVVIASYALLNRVYEEMTARENGTYEEFAEILEAGPAPAAVLPDGQMALFALPGDEPALEAVDVEDQDDETDPPANIAALLLDTYWHDLVADEAEVLRSTGSKQATALWQLRGNAQVAVALTGTPINRGIDDLGRLLSWCRGDADLFRGVKLSTQYNLADPEELEQLSEAMGGVLFRVDTSEVSDEMPDIDAVVMRLKPSAAEKALADAARMELKRVYEELLQAIEQAELTDPDNPDYADARSALRAARGAHLGGTTLARMASSDPAALLGSESAGAALLAGHGLIEAATQQTGTKRAAVVQDTMSRVANGEAVLIFTEFATVARGLIDDLDAAGIKVGSVLGGGGVARDRMIEEFRNGDLDVLVATSSGERGLNLQRASTIVHYDLPWAPKGVVQRTGRALRLESENQKVTLVFPLMEGTVEERVAATVVRRALEAMYALDKSRGVDISRTEIGRALGGLAASLGDTATGRAHGEDLLEITRQLVG